MPYVVSSVTLHLVLEQMSLMHACKVLLQLLFMLVTQSAL